MSFQKIYDHSKLAYFELDMIGGGKKGSDKKGDKKDSDKKDKINIVILHYPKMFEKPEIPTELDPIIKKLSDIGKVHHYFFKFAYYGNEFTLDDLLFENVAKDINNTFDHLKNYLIIALNHACPMALHYVDRYPDKCLGIVCYPYRFYSKESYERRIWKLKNNNGWKSWVKSDEYNIDDYLLEINNTRLQKLLKDPQKEEIEILFLIMDLNLQKQHDKIPKIFKVPTVLYTRLDMNVPSIIKNNYERKDIAKMKQIINEDDALYNSMIWNFDRVKYDAILKDANNENDYLKIKYLISGWEDNDDILNEVILFTYRSDYYE